jgi:hypothetical protein
LFDSPFPRIYTHASYARLRAYDDSADFPLLRYWLICLSLLVSAPAGAQFSAPYDPDFAQPKKDEGPAASPDENEPAVILPRLSGKFLLKDRKDPSKIFEEPGTDAPRMSIEFDDFQRDYKPFQYSQTKWNTMRDNVEAGKEPKEGLEEYVPTYSVFATTEAPRPAPPEIELPAYGTSLSITGRKVISFQFSEKRFLHEQKNTARPATTNLFEINQELQLRMQGKVGPKITVNVDYDDTKQNKQDISVVYQGDPNEVVQNVSFGDIDLSLPATEFVSYNKQLFGIRGDIKYKGFKATFIGSRTKGTTKFKQFYGNTQFVAIDLLDTAYIRRTYYDVSFSSGGRLPIKPGTERIFIARSQTGATNINDVTLTVDDLAVQTSTFTGRFVQLAAGADYTIDYIKGIVTLKNAAQAQDVLAIDYTDAHGVSITVQSTNTLAGGSGLLKIIKTPADVPIVVSSETGHNRELKTFYSIGQTQIVRDNGRGNFILQVQDKNRTEVGSGLLPIQKYPDTINVDFENGLFQLQAPFSVSNTSASTPDPELYSPTPISKRLFRVEYNFRFKTFFLEPSLVAQSEVITLDSIKLVRNVDYFIDYEAGFVTFFNEDRIRPESTITMAYEVAPFAAIANESLLGTRVSYDIHKNFSMGTTLLYQGGTKAPSVPNISDLAKSLLTYEFDSQLRPVKLFDTLTVNAALEVAQSRQNVNLNKFALIDNMEGIKQEDSASVIASAWKVSANPGGIPTDPTRISVFSEDVKVLDINPRAEADKNETQKVLGVGYDFSTAASTEASIVFPFSLSGVDFSQKSILEVVMLGDNSNNSINFHLGGINEDSDGDGVLDTEDLNNDAILQTSEDNGYLYNAAGKPSTRYGAQNGVIDSEDLNKNNRLDPADFTGDDFGYAGSIATGNDQLFNATDSSTHTFVNFGSDKWRTFQIPLNISTATAGRWNAIKQIRVSVRLRAGGTNVGALKFARIAVVGNTWQAGKGGDPDNSVNPNGNETLTVTPVNSVDNPTYTPIFNAGGEASESFTELYGNVGNLQKQTGSKNISEQALQLEFTNLGAAGLVTTKRRFTRAIDTSQHHVLNFLLFGNADLNNVDNSGNRVFFLRAGDDKNYFEARVPITFTGWKRFRVEQADLNGDSIADEWKSQTQGMVVVSSGNPTLQHIGQLVAGIQAVGAGAARGRVFLNEIYVAQPITRVGTAIKVETNFELPGWATFGIKHRSVDRNFQTPTSVVSNQDNTVDSGYLNFSRFGFFPMSFNLQKSVVDTPSTVRTGDLSNIVNILQQGKVTTWNGSASGNFSYGALPRLTLGHTRNRIEYDLLTRMDDRQTYNASLSYGVPVQFFALPRTVDATYTHSLYDVSFGELRARKISGNYTTKELAQTYGLRLAFVPWFGSSFNPSYSLSRVGETRNDFTGLEEKTIKYRKSLSQNVSVSSNYRLLSWLNPQANYSVDIIENNVLNISTFVVGTSTHIFQIGEVKTVNRSANGSVNLPIVIGEIFPNFRVTRSMNIAAGYQIQDGDVWNNVEDALRTETKLWIRSPLRPRSPAAQRSNQTLRDTYSSTQRWSPLEAFGIGGRLAPVRTLSLSNNYIKSIQRTDVTGTVSKTISTTFPDLVASISQLEQMLFAERWMNNVQMNFKYNAHQTVVVNTSEAVEESFGTDLRAIIRRKFDTLVNYNNRTSRSRDLRVGETTQTTSHEDSTVQVTFDYDKFRFTPKVDYANDKTKLGSGVLTQNLTVITPSLLMRADLALPRGLRLPGSTRTLLFTNRIIWTTTTAVAFRRSPVTAADNSTLFTLNTSGDYEIARNLRMTLNGSASRLWHKTLKEEEFVSYQFGSTLTFQF